MENGLNYDSLLDDKDVQNTDDGQVTNFNDIQNDNDPEFSEQTNNVVTDSLITRYLKDYGIEDPSKMKFENEDGTIEDVDFNSLDDDEKLNILKSISDIGLSEDETEAINYMRRNGKNLSQIIDYFAQERLNAYLNEHPEDVHQKKYTIDDYNDEELYLADLQAKYPNFTDEELFSKLDSAKENEELFKKEVEALRAEYKEDEDNYNKQLEQKEQEDYQRLQDNLQRAASEFNEVLLDPDDPESDSLQIEDSDRQQIMQYLLEQDKDGKSRFVRDIEDPKSLVQLAWLRLQGNNAITDTTRYWKQVLQETRRENARLTKELENYKNKQTNNSTVVKEQKNNNQNNSIGSIWDNSGLI